MEAVELTKGGMEKRVSAACRGGALMAIRPSIDGNDVDGLGTKGAQREIDASTFAGLGECLGVVLDVSGGAGFANQSSDSTCGFGVFRTSVREATFPASSFKLIAHPLDVRVVNADLLESRNMDAAVADSSEVLAEAGKV